MSRNESCVPFLNAMRVVVKRDTGRTDKGWSVLHHHGQSYTVYDKDGKEIWYGDAHCRYCARCEALSKAGVP